jgi:hypothetical protein
MTPEEPSFKAFVTALMIGLMKGARRPRTNAVNVSLM